MARRKQSAAGFVLQAYDWASGEAGGGIATRANLRQTTRYHEAAARPARVTTQAARQDGISATEALYVIANDFVSQNKSDLPRRSLLALPQSVLHRRTKRGAQGYGERNEDECGEYRTVPVRAERGSIFVRLSPKFKHIAFFRFRVSVQSVIKVLNPFSAEALKGPRWPMFATRTTPPMIEPPATRVFLV